MNYRHQFHAGNFADVMKHVLLVQLVRALQAKPKGFLYLDTHAGRGSYDLTASAQGDSRARTPEWPGGIGRLWTQPLSDPVLQEYVSLVRQFNAERGGPEQVPAFYPGSPWIARALARPADRLALCEKHPEEFAALQQEFLYSPGTSVHELDAYVAIRAMLPPRERRAVVLIDPPFEAQDEFVQIARGVGEGLRRLPGAVFAIWYPLTARARVDLFFAELLAARLPATISLELAVAPESGGQKLRGCGLAVINPPWRFETVARPALTSLSELLAEEPGGGARIVWVVPET